MTGYQESSTPILGKLQVRPKKKPNFQWEIRKIQPNQESSFGRLGKLGKFIRNIRNIRKVHSENQESSFGKFGKFIRNIRKMRKVNQENFSSILGKFLLNIRKITPQKNGFRSQKQGENTFCNCASQQYHVPSTTWYCQFDQVQILTTGIDSINKQYQTLPDYKYQVHDKITQS